MSEFDIIQRYFTNLGVSHAETVIGVGDDAAVMNIPEDSQLVTTVDTMLEGVHFFKKTPPALLATKLVAVNLSDLAAMGAYPKWAMLSLTLPNIDHDWLQSFSKALSKLLTRYDVQLIGGDTTKGHFAFSLSVFGLVPLNKAILRSNAQIGDDVYLSGTVGDAAIGLQITDRKLEQYQLDDSHFLQALYQPEPRVKMALMLADMMHSCIDVSDGVVSELQHIAKASDVGMEIEINKLPLSKPYQHFIQQGGHYDYALYGGEDYELCFTIAPGQETMLGYIAEQCGASLTKIGTVTDSGTLHLTLNGEPVNVNQSGYDHFT